MLAPEDEDDQEGLLNDSLPALPVISGAMGDMYSDPLGGLESGRGKGSYPGTPSPPTGVCACLSVAYYQPFFNVDTSDVKDRLMATLTFWRADPTFLNLVGDAPDLYGPFWLATTLIFVVSVTSNLARTLVDGSNYDFELVTACVSVVYGYLALAPLAVWLAAKYLLGIPSIGYVQLTCLVGYSLLLYLPAAALAVVHLLAWPAVGLAGAAATAFLVRSLKPLLEPKREKAVTVLGLVLCMQLLFVLVLKLQFYVAAQHFEQVQVV